MRRTSWIVAGMLVTMGVAAPFAQKTTPVHPGKAGSPHVKTEATVDGASISVEYGRPSLKGRTPGKDVDPYMGKPWRTGADEATVLTTDKPLKFGTLSLAPGSYTLNTQPNEKGWDLIVGKLGKPAQWGVPYQAALEIGRAPMKVGKTSAPVEQLLITITDTPGGGDLRVDWGNTSAVIPFTVG
jgi:Protein of unknown function (DUF2911)